MVMKKRKAYSGTIYLYDKGKCYGATTRQVNAFNKSGVRTELKKRFKFKNNRVVVKNIKPIAKTKPVKRKR